MTSSRLLRSGSGLSAIYIDIDLSHRYPKYSPFCRTQLNQRTKHSRTFHVSLSQSHSDTFTPFVHGSFRQSRAPPATFDHRFSNNVTAAKAHFTGKDDLVHLAGLSIYAFLRAALTIEVCLFLFSSAFSHLLIPNQPQQQGGLLTEAIGAHSC